MSPPIFRGLSPHDMYAITRLLSPARPALITTGLRITLGERRYLTRRGFVVPDREWS